MLVVLDLGRNNYLTDIEVAQFLWQKFREMSLRVEKYFVKIDFLEMLDFRKVVITSRGYY